ncbi:MAG TPA: aldehyde dehydrogenase family protein [Streptomyces sp.]
MPAATGAAPLVDALVPSGTYRTGRRETVRDVTGRPLAELSLVPALYLSRTLDRLRRAPASSAALPPAQLTRRLRAAAEAFTSATLGGTSPQEHDRLVARSTGVPVSVVRDAGRTVADVLSAAVDSVAGARPRTTLPPSTRAGDVSRTDAAPRITGVVWRRRGRLLGVHASGNHPAVHSLWPEALALGYRVAVRPSRRDPFTPHRLVLALRAAGFADDDVVTLPCEHATADALVRGSDLAMVFGGDETVRRYAGGPTPVLAQGPGRVKVLVAGEWEPYLDVIAESVGALGGVSCLNATAVLVERDAPGFAEALAARLAALRPGPPQEEDTQLPCLPLQRARETGEFLRRAADGCAAVLGDVVHDLGDGSASMRPAVHLVADSGARQVGLELPFPCVWVAPWSPEQGVAPLRDSLVVGVRGGSALVDALLDEPSVRNVYGLDRPTWWLPPGVPHDGHLAEFLMRSTALAGI